MKKHLQNCLAVYDHMTMKSVAIETVCDDYAAQEISYVMSSSDGSKVDHEGEYVKNSIS